MRADPISAVCDHDFAEMPATFEMAVCLLRLGKRERPIDHGAQAVHRNCPVHGLEIDSTLLDPETTLTRAKESTSITSASRALLKRPRQSHGDIGLARRRNRRIAFDTARAKALAAGKEPAILVRHDISTEDVAGFAVATGILTATGGRTAHAAVVARKLGKVWCSEAQLPF